MILKAIKKKKKRLSCCLLSACNNDLSCYVKLFMNGHASPSALFRDLILWVTARRDQPHQRGPT